MSGLNKKISAVGLLDLKAQYATLRSELESAVLDVCASQHFIMGPRVSDFEQQLASYCDSQFAVGVSSGSDALLMALMALDIGVGDEVITTPFTFFATAGAIARVGAVPVFCDIDADTYNLDPARVAGFVDEHCSRRENQLVNNKTGRIVRCIIPVHLFGQTADMKSIMQLANDHQLFVIEDAAQAIGSRTSEGANAGALGDIGCFSFFPSKNLGAFGDAGMCVTQNEQLAQKMRKLRLHGSQPKYHHEIVGGNFRLDAIQAAVLQVKLPYLDQWTEKRQEHASAYTDLLSPSSGHLRLPQRVEGCRHIYNQYTIATDSRDEFRAHLSDNNIGNEVYYPVPLHLQACFEYLGYGEGEFPVAEAAARSVVSIPVYPELTKPEQQYVASHVNSFFSV